MLEIPRLYAKADIEAITVSKNFNDESKDAYFQTTTHNFAKGDLQPLTLRRPFGKQLAKPGFLPGVKFLVDFCSPCYNTIINI